MTILFDSHCLVVWSAPDARFKPTIGRRASYWCRDFSDDEVAACVALRSHRQLEVRHSEFIGCVRLEPVQLGVVQGVAVIDWRPASAEDITPAQRAVCMLVAQGLKNKEIAEQLGVKLRTVEARIAAATKRVGLSNRADIARFVSSCGWCS